MKKILSVGSVIAIVVGAGFLIFNNAYASPSTVYVDASATSSGNGTAALPYQTIQAGVTAAQSGDTVDVASGTYAEAVSITKDLTIVGAGATSTVITAPGTLPAEGAIINVDGTGVSADISGLTVKGPGPTGCGSLMSGVFISGGAYASIHNMTFADIRDNPLSGCQNGRAVLIGWGHGNTIPNTTGSGTVSHVTISDYQKAGIEVSGVGSSATITNNTITGVGPTAAIAQNGIEVTYGASGNVSGNTVTGNSYTGSDFAAGILLYEAAATTTVGTNSVSGNQFGLWTNDQTSFPAVSISGITGNTARNVVADTTGWSTPTSTVVDASFTGTSDANGGDIVPGGVIGYSAFTTIQAAVNAVAAGGTVTVAAGTYPETVTISKALTLNGAQMGVLGANASGTQRSGSESLVKAMAITASDVIVNGFSLTNNGIQMDLNNPPTAASGIVVENNIFSGYNSVGMPTNHAGDLIVEGNLFKSPASNSEPMQFKSDGVAGGCDGTQVKNNVLVGAANNGGADINFSCTGSNSSNVTVSRNVDTGNTGGTSFVAFSGIADSISITGNHVAGSSGSAIFFWGGVTGTADISDNSITGGASKAVNIQNMGATYGGASTGNFTINNNDFSNNAYGINIGTMAVNNAGTVTANGNNFSGDVTAGVENDVTPTSTAVLATGNWWGAANGPHDAVSGDGSTPDTNASGTGSPAIGAVNYSGWCTNLVCDGVPPTVTVIPVAGSVLNGTTTFTITVSDNNPLDPTKNTKVWVYLYDTAGAQKSQGANVNLSTGTGTFTVDTTKLDNGAAWLDVGIVYDAAGNPSGKTDNYFKNYDIENATSGPSIPTLLWPLNGEIMTGANLTAAQWNAVTDPAGGITYVYQSSQSSSTNLDGSFVNPAYTSGALSATSIPTLNTPAGIYYWHVQAKDAHGYVSPWSSVWMFTVDNGPSPALTTCAAGTTASLVETDVVNSSLSSPTAGTHTLANGQTYLLVASGTWQNGSRDAADASYVSADNWMTYLMGDDVPPYMLGDGSLSLQVDGSFVNWGAYQPTHEYAYLYAGTGSPVNFMVFDGDATVASPTANASWYGDNSGNLDINVYACNAPVSYVTTNAATGVITDDATLNGANVDDAASGHSFWVSTSTFSTASPNVPNGVYSTPDFGLINASTTFSASLSSLTTNAVLSGGAPGTMPAISPNTTYYYAAWSEVNDTWYPGTVLSVTTSPAPHVTTDAATGVTSVGATMNGKNGPVDADNTSFWWGTTLAGPFTAGGNTTEFPASGWNHDTGLGSASASGTFSESLTNLLPGTEYYFVAWSEIGGVWYPGDVLCLTTPTLGGDDTLSALGASGGILTPGFDPSITSYTVLLPHNATTIPTVTATTTDANATDTITQATSTTGTATVAVVAQNGSSTKDYTVTFSLASATTTLLHVIVLVDNSRGGHATSSDFTVNMVASNPSITTFPGSALGTDVTMDPATFLGINISSLPNYIPGSMGNCSGVSGIAGDSADCTIKETYNETIHFTSGSSYGHGGGQVLGASITGDELLQQQIAALQAQLLALLQQYLTMLYSHTTH